MPDKRRNHHKISENTESVERQLIKAVNEAVLEEATSTVPQVVLDPSAPGRNAQAFEVRERRLARAREIAQDRMLTDYDAKRINRILREIAVKDMEATKLYEPMPHQLSFHKSQAPERILLGGNRCGKTLATAMELTWAVLGMHPYIDYPKENGRAIVVGKDLGQLAQVFWRKLTRREPTFRMITDLETGKWRAYRPYDPSDMLRKKDSKPMLRLIPERYIKKVAWEDKARDVPSMIQLTNGWEILFRSGVGKPPQGLDVDLVLFDEEIPDSSWYGEMAARLLDRNGRFIWGATPQAGTDQLYALHERAIDEAGKEFPLCEEFKVTLHENQFLTSQQRAQLIAKYADSPEDTRVRIEGDFLSTSFLVYPNWSIYRHGFPWFQIPDDWMRLAVFDPGFANFAMLLFAVPPPRCVHETKTRDGQPLVVKGDHVYLYDELFLKHSDIKTIGEACRQKMSGQNFEVFIIDKHHSIKHETSGKRIELQYEEQFIEHGLRSNISGSGFIYGNDDVIAGVERVRSWLWERNGAPPKLRVLHGIAPWFEREMKRYMNLKVGGKVKTPIKPDQTKNNHTMDALRYAVCYDPKYTAPTKKSIKSPAVLRFLAKRKKAGGTGVVNCAPGA